MSRIEIILAIVIILSIEAVHAVLDVAREIAWRYSPRKS